jgi:predicted site-specific integrase-resolvase
LSTRLELIVDGFRLWLLPKEAMQLLSCCRTTLRAYRLRGKIRIRQTPKGHYRYWRDDILNLLKPAP